MVDERCVRIWLDDHDAVFRLGLAACVGERAGMVLAGQGTGFRPAPPAHGIDVLVFGLGALPAALRLTAGTPVALVALADDLNDGLVIDAIEAGVAGLVVRRDMTAAGFVECLRQVAAGHAYLPGRTLLDMASRSRVVSRPPGTPLVTSRDRDLLQRLAQGASTREIAGELRYSEKTVKNRIQDLLGRLHCHNRVEAVALAAREGLI